MGEKRLFALRGATQCLNENPDISRRTLEMYDELLSRNNLSEEDIVSVIFSVTGDLDAKNPATALREEGRVQKAALFVTQEARFMDSLAHVIRVLIHCYLDAAHIPVNVYQNGAEILRKREKRKEKGEKREEGGYLDVLGNSMSFTLSEG